VGTLYHPSLASFDSAEHTVLQKGVKSFLWIEPGRCMGAESGGDSVRKEQMSCDRHCIPGSSCVPPTRNFPVSIIRQAWNSFAAGRGLRQYQVSSGAVAWYVPKALIDSDRVSYADGSGKLHRVGCAACRSELPRERFSRVLGMFSSSEVKVLYPT